MSYTLDQLYGIRDQVVVVTGAAGGIGLELCQTIRNLGGRVTAAVRDPKGWERILEALYCPNLSTEKDVLCIVAGLTHEEAVEAATEQIDRYLGRIGRLANVAGMNIVESLEKMTLNDPQEIVDTSFTSVIICCKYTGGYMLRIKKGRVVNISSLSTVKGKAYYTAYASSKATVDSFIRALAIEWAQQGTNVSSVTPGMIVTGINRKQIEENPRSYERQIESIPRGYVGRTEWLVMPVIMLLSPGSTHMTGQVVFVNEGCMAGDTFVMETECFE